MRRDDPADRVAAGQHDPAMIHHCMERTFGGALRQGRTIDDRAATGGAPVGFRGFGENGMAMTADAFHVVSVEEDADTNQAVGAIW